VTTPARPRVHITGPVPTEIRDELASSFELLDEPAGADGILSLLTTRVDGTLLDDAASIGDLVTANETLVTIHYNSDVKLADATALIENSFVFSDQPVPPKKLVRRLVGA